MNIKEIKRKISDRSAIGIGPEEFLAGHIGMRDYAVELLNALDEPQKPVVPEFVAEWIEYAKKKGDSLAISFKPWNLYGVEYSKADRWIEDNQETFARAWLDGYEVEKEPLWVVAVHDGEYYFTRFMSNHNPEDRFPWDSIMDKDKGYHFTDKEKADAVALLIGGTVEEVVEG